MGDFQHPLRRSVTLPLLARVKNLNENCSSCVVLDELEELDSRITLTQILIDLASEVLVGAGCDNVIEHEAVVRTIKLFAGNITESLIQVMFCYSVLQVSNLTDLSFLCFQNTILKSFNRLDDLDIFTSPTDENTQGLDELKERLLRELMSAVPTHGRIFLGDHETSEALKFLIKSLETKKINRDLFLQLLDVLASQLLASSRSNNQATASY